MGGSRRRASVLRVGVDTGGTFTDFVATDGRRVWTHKVLSTPADPARAVLSGLADLLEGGLPGGVTYASTVATNAVLERRGARVVVLTTEGFEDVLEIGRQIRPDLYALEPRRVEPLVPASRRVGVRERTLADGRVARALTAAEVSRLVRRLEALRAQAVAVCLLHSYRNPQHEEALARALARTGLPVTVSSRLVREYREFERFSTTVLNAYVSPAMGSHLRELQAGLAGVRLRVMQSSGGAVAPELAAAEAVRTLLSGPAAGVIGGVRAAARLGLDRIITFDMGGTSTDVSLVDGRPRLRTEWEIGGFPVKVPAIDVHTVGAGGGSLARLDEGGALKVGPQSAGADPGPACYGRGDQPTVTDADVVLGRLVPAAFLGGRMRIEAARAERAVARLAAAAGGTTEAVAEGIVRVVQAAMERAIRRISVERGHDPRDYALVAFGGAAGMHACELAAALGIRTVVLPVHPGLLSAWGALAAEWQRDAVKTVRLVDPPARVLARELAGLCAAVRSDLRACAGRSARVRVMTLLDVRYAGQSHEVAIPFGAGYREAFHRAHRQLYGHADPQRPVEVVNVRAVGTVPGAGAPATAAPVLPGAPDSHALWWRGRRVRAARWERERLPRRPVRGPAVVTEATATLFVPPGWRVERQPGGDLIVRHEGSAGGGRS